jgi:hypothetical protein
VLRLRASAATTASRPDRPAANGGPSTTPANGGASWATAKPTSWTAFRSASRGTFRAEHQGTMARDAARCPAKFPAQRRALDADDSGAAQPHASTGEHATADYYARRRRGSSRLGSSTQSTGARSVRIPIHSGTRKSRAIATAANRNREAKGNTGTHPAAEKRIPAR